jgi:hypothetical protein
MPMFMKHGHSKFMTSVDFDVIRSKVIFSCPINDLFWLIFPLFFS